MIHVDALSRRTPQDARSNGSDGKPAVPFEVSRDAGSAKLFGGGHRHGPTELTVEAVQVHSPVSSVCDCQCIATETIQTHGREVTKFSRALAVSSK